MICSQPNYRSKISFELIFSMLIALNISLLFYAIIRVAHQFGQSRSKSELGIKNFDYTRTTKRKEQDKQTLAIITYLIGTAGALLLTGNLNPLMFIGGIAIMLISGALFAILQLSK